MSLHFAWETGEWTFILVSNTCYVHEMKQSYTTRCHGNFPQYVIYTSSIYIVPINKPVWWIYPKEHSATYLTLYSLAHSYTTGHRWILKITKGKTFNMKIHYTSGKEHYTIGTCAAVHGTSAISYRCIHWIFQRGGPMMKHYCMNELVTLLLLTCKHYIVYY